jgi:hypothetical protein
MLGANVLTGTQTVSSGNVALPATAVVHGHSPTEPLQVLLALFHVLL